MPGTIIWNASFVPSNGKVSAEIYDKEGMAVQSKRVGCRPPVNCEVVMDNVEPGEYTAALAVGSDRYYYVEGQAIITRANDLTNASPVEVANMDQEVLINIYVNII